MLNHYFKYPGVLRRMRLGPLGAEIDRVAEHLERTGYTYFSAKRYLSLIASFSRYALQSGCVQVTAVDHALVERFLRELRCRAVLLPPPARPSATCFATSADIQAQSVCRRRNNAMQCC